MKRRSDFLYLLLFLFLLPYSLHGQRKQTRTMKATEQAIELSPAEIRLMLERFFEDFTLDVKAGADSILQLSDDLEVQRNALRWKISATTAIQQSILVPDPFAGMVDQAALTYQMDHFFKDGNGTSAFKDHQAVAVRTCDRLSERIRKMILSLSEDRDLAAAEDFLEEFARQNPIENIYFIRPSVLPAFGDLIGGPGGGIGKVTRSLEESMERLTFAMNVSLLQLSDQVLWKAELAALDMLDKTSLELPASVDSLIHESLEDVDTLQRQMERMVDLAATAPKLVDEQREKIFQDIGRERAIILGAIQQEKTEVLTDVDRKLLDLTEKVTKERIATLEKLDSLSERRVHESFDRLDALVRRTLFQGAVLGALLILLLFLFLFLWKRFLAS